MLCFAIQLAAVGYNAVANLGILTIGGGHPVPDLGVDVPIEKFVEAVRENPDVKVVGVSALLTTTMPAMKDTVEALNKEDFRKNIKIMVGGAVLTQEYADMIGADFYGKDAMQAVYYAERLLNS